MCEEHKAKTESVENGVQRRIFGPNRKEGTGDWGKLHK
jgi:hypothetical protein